MELGDVPTEIFQRENKTYAQALMQEGAIRSLKEDACGWSTNILSKGLPREGREERQKWTMQGLVAFGCGKKSP